MFEERYVIEVDGKPDIRVESIPDAYCYILGIIEGASSFGWVKIERISDNPRTYKLRIKQDNPIGQRIKVRTIVIKPISREEASEVSLPR